MQDLWFALRLLRTRPGFTLAAVIPLAAAIACATAVLTLVDAVLYRPLGVKNPASLVAIYGYSRSKAAYLSDSWPEFRDVSALSGVVDSATAYVRITVNADLGGGSERLAAELVSGGYFGTVGVAPVLGRALGPEDDRPDAAPALLVSYRLWSSRFQRSRAALGATMRIGDAAFSIAGVMPEGYTGTLLDWGAAPQLWIPMAYLERLAPGFASIDYRNRADVRWAMMTARLKHGTAVQSAQAALDVLEAQRRTSNPAAYRDHRLVALPSEQARFFPAYRDAAVRFLSLLAAVSAAVLLIACFNLVNLLAARVAAREKETTTRLALGASRGRIFRQFLIESLVLTGCAVMLGLPPAIQVTRWLAGFPQFLSISLNLNLSPDSRALLWSAGASLLAGVLIGMACALRAGRTDLVSGLNNAQARAGGRWGIGVRDLLVAVQVACAMLVLISAVMLARSLRNLEGARPGYNTRDVLLATVDIGSTRRTPAEIGQFYRALLADLRLSGPAALISEALPANTRFTRQVTPQGSAAAVEVEGNVVSDGFFAVARMPIEAGREFTAGDDGQSLSVVILNHSAATLFWPGENAVGRSIRIAGEGAARVVAGVVADAQYHPLASSPIPYFFLPLGQSPRSQMTIYVHRARPLELAATIERAVHRLDRTAPVFGVRTLEEQVASGFAQVRLAALSTSAVGLLGTVLALVGVFAMTAWRVAQQRRDIAIRIALGADHGHVVAAFAAKGFAIGGAGALAGAAMAVWTSGFLRSSIRGVAPPDAAVFVGAAVLLLALVLAASVIPARRISGIDPAGLLRVQ